MKPASDPMRVSRRTIVQGAACAALTVLRKGAKAAPAAPPPVLYLSHGAPIFALNDPARIAELRAWGARLARPRGIVVMTPHFGSRRLELGTTGKGFAMYDLPPMLKRRIPANLDYATPPSVDLALQVDALAGTQGARSAGRRGFDHTTWMPLACLFPAADVPVVELTYPYEKDAELFALGTRMARLRDEGVLFLASGGMTHNLASMDPARPADARPPAWSTDFDAWATERLVARDVDALVG